MYAIDEIAKKHGIKILRTPPYHCVLNPIEMYWSQFKGHTCKRNADCKVTSVMRHAKEVREELNQNKTYFQNICRKTLENEHDFRKKDNVRDSALMAPLIIENNNVTSSDDINTLSDEL